MLWVLYKGLFNWVSIVIAMANQNKKVFITVQSMNSNLEQGNVLKLRKIQVTKLQYFLVWYLGGW